ncbi:hypothetical protein DNTS_016496, partial [Danionella cerebrum]
VKMEVEDHFRSLFEERLSLNKDEYKGLACVNPSVMRLLEVREECANVTRALEAQKEVDKLYLLDVLVLKNVLTQMRLRAIKKTDSERAQIRVKVQEINKLQEEIDVLMARKEILQERVGKVEYYHEFFQRAVKMSGKFKSPRQLIDRLQGLLSSKKELVENLRVLEKEREVATQELMQYMNQQRMVLLHSNNQLHQVQTELDSMRLEAYRWELKLKHFSSTAAKETLEFAHIKSTICNIYQMTIAHKKIRSSQHTDDTFTQLEMIQKYFQLMESIGPGLQFNCVQRPNEIEEGHSGNSTDCQMKLRNY